MELKPFCGMFDCKYLFRINRTSVELKRCSSIVMSIKRSRINRTSVELKLKIYGGRTILLMLD